MLKGKIALVTGAAQGIGKETALLLALEGATVVISDIDDEMGSQVQSIAGSGTIYLHLDVASEQDWLSVMKEIESRYGVLDILVNNAGITGFQEGFGPQDPESASLESFKAVHEVNLMGTFLGCKHAIPLMKHSKSASIVNISSRSGLVGIGGAAAYASSKAAIRNHTKSVAIYCCQMGYPIRCNSVHPAAIMTPMWEPMLGNGAEREANLKKISDEIPMKRMGSAKEVAEAILFLASDKSSYITGIELNVDGGILAGSVSAPKKNE